jgi:zinc finger protein 362/384
MHSQPHAREAKPYKCTQCTKSFANSSYLSQHTRIHLGIKPYRCEICQRKFTQLSHLQQHIRTHTGDKPYKCRHAGCVKQFSQLSNLQSHSRCHATDKPFKCNSCYKCFQDETALLDHIPKHKESKHLKTHICQYCGKSYTQETYLAKHLQKHIERNEKRANAIQSNLGIGRNSNNSEHTYWPKISPDSVAILSESIQQHQQNQYDFVINQQPTNEQMQNHRTALELHHRNGGNNANVNGSDDVGEDLVIRENATQQSTTSQTNQHAPSSSSSIILAATSTYDSATKTTTNSAFTPINVMTPHLSTLQHHQLAQRPIYYDAITFQNKNIPQNSANSFPNQLISLHQIRNYAHQPAGIVTNEHLISIGTSISKDRDNKPNIL